MNYLQVIKTSFYYFPIIALFITIPFIIKNYRKYGSIHKLRTLIIYSFILYLLTIYFLVILPLPSIKEVSELTTPKVNLIPFSFVIDFIKETPFTITKPSTYISFILDSSFYVVIFNIIMFIPFGMYQKYYYQSSLKKTIILSFLLSLFFELTQLSGLYFIYPRPYRLFDIDDLILNTIGGITGYYLVNFIINYLPSRSKIDNESYLNGQIVSPLRRILIFFSEIIFFFFFTIILSIFINNHLLLSSFIIYFFLIPILWQGKTLGSNFLKVKRHYIKRYILNTFLYPIFLVIYYFLIPNIIIYFIIYYAISLSNIISLIIIIISLILYLLFYLSNIIYLFIKKKMYYDSFFSLEYLSTIKIDKFAKK